MRNWPKWLLPPSFSLSLSIHLSFSWNSPGKNYKNEQNSLLYISNANFTMMGCPHIFLFSSFFKNTISSSCTRNFNFMRLALQVFLGKKTHFCYIIHLKIISVSSTPFAKKHLVTFACINFVLLKTLMALISIACAIVQCFNNSAVIEAMVNGFHP